LSDADIWRMVQDNLNLPVGKTVQLQLDSPEETPRHAVRVIGYLPGGSLVVSAPTQNGKFVLVRPGLTYNVRMLRGDSVVGFSVKVLHTAAKPYPHLHLEYPKSLEQIVVRNSARVSARIDCNVRNTNLPDSPENFRKAHIVDLSESGAKIASVVPLGEPGDMLQVNFHLDVVGATEQLTLVADIKNIFERLEAADDKKKLIHLNGVQFRAVNRFQQLLLHAWVMGQVVDSSGKIEK
jgi:c-di-GMP-binding flagellar brake protein YcgR